MSRPQSCRRPIVCFRHGYGDEWDFAFTNFFLVDLDRAARGASPLARSTYKWDSTQSILDVLSGDTGSKEFAQKSLSNNRMEQHIQLLTPRVLKIEEEPKAEKR